MPLKWSLIPDKKAMIIVTIVFLVFFAFWYVGVLNPANGCEGLTGGCDNSNRCDETAGIPFKYHSTSFIEYKECPKGSINPNPIAMHPEKGINIYWIKKDSQSNLLLYADFLFWILVAYIASVILSMKNDR